jgi:hypothetical protein
MIEVTVKLKSARGPHRDRLLGVGIISNNLLKSVQTNGTRGDYKVILFRAGKKKVVYREGKVENFSRKKHLGWDLLYLALKNTIGDKHENKVGSDKTKRESIYRVQPLNNNSSHTRGDKAESNRRTRVRYNG